MKLLDHCYAIKNLLSKGASSDDFSYTLRLIAHFLKVSRGLLIEQKADKYHYISDLNYQSLCTELEAGHYHNCCDVDAGCTILRSKDKVPAILNARWGRIAKVTTIDGSVIPSTNITIKKLSKYSITNTKPKTGYFFHDGYLYVLNNNDLEIVLINALFSEPEVIEQKNCSTNGGDSCPDFLDTEFPIDSDLVAPMYKLTMEYLLNSMQAPHKHDTSNNAQDETVS